MEPDKLIAIAGPTASGKTKISIDAALEVDAEIVSSDSLLVYKHLDVGTAKPTLKEQRLVKHHLIDIVEPWDDYTIADFTRDATSAIENIKSRNKRFITTGGTGFYLNALINKTFESPGTDLEIRQELDQRIKNGETLADLHKELEAVDPKTAKRVHPNDSYRIFRALEVYYSTGKTMTHFREKHQKQGNSNFAPLIIVLNPDRQELISNIEARTKKMFDRGLVEEAEKLFKMGCTPELKPLKSIGYKQVVQMLSGKINKDEAIESIKKETAALAKRQITWFKKQPFTIWMHPTKDIDKITDIIRSTIC